jgi:hypothetical protein
MNAGAIEQTETDHPLNRWRRPRLLLFGCLTGRPVSSFRWGIVPKKRSQQ